MTTQADIIVNTVNTRTDNECWHWLGAHNNKGYPMVKFQGKVVGAYRASYELRYGPIPDGHEADHICSNNWCWNPDHIRPLTHLANIRLGAGNQHSQKVHCINGHLLVGDNIQNRTDRRICLTCRRERERKYKLSRSLA